VSAAERRAPARPIASTAPVRPTPKITAKNSASSMPGNATAMLMPAFTARRCGGRGGTTRVPSSSPTTTAIDGRGQRQLDREPGGDQGAVDDVAAQVVGAGPVLGGRAGQDVVGVDGVRVVGPQDRGHHGEHQHRRP
jgi:hypothetical protein